MTNAELKAIVQREEYDFLRTNKHLGSNILFLTLSGSHAYGTNVEGSDIDIRGVAGSPEILGFNHFEQAIDNRTDTVIYAVNKFVSLLAQGNPNIIELLGNDPELYVNMTPEGQMLLDNRELFLTRRIAYSYGGFANDQLRRLQMGLLRNRVSPEALKNKFEKRSLERAIAGWGKDDIFEISISEDTDELKELKTIQRHISRCKAGSNNRKKAIKELNRIYRKMCNQRTDWFFKTAYQLIGDYAIICIEDLNLAGIQKLWGRKINDIAFGEFVQILEWAASNCGTEIVKIDRFAPSSKCCSRCGYIYTKLTLKQREWDCPSCGTHHERDVNAAINICRMGLVQMGYPA